MSWSLLLALKSPRKVCLDGCWHPLSGKKKDYLQMQSAGCIRFFCFFFGIFILDSKIAVYT